MQISLPTVLFTIFLILKLTHVIAWPWIYVFMPLLAGLGLGLIIMAVALVLLWTGEKW